MMRWAPSAKLVPKGASDNKLTTMAVSRKNQMYQAGPAKCCAVPLSLTYLWQVVSGIWAIGSPETEEQQKYDQHDEYQR
jgi:hypothetical protein